MKEILEKGLIALAQKALNALMSGEAKTLMYELVEEMFDTDHTNDEKRQYVKERVYPLLGSIGKIFVSTLIAITVDTVKIMLEQRITNGN